MERLDEEGLSVFLDSPCDGESSSQFVSNLLKIPQDEAQTRARSCIRGMVAFGSVHLR
jgi:hypothetical protein